MIYRLKRVGNALYLNLSETVLREIGITEKTDIDIVVSDGALIIRPKKEAVSYEKHKADMEKIAEHLLQKYGPLLERLSKA